MRSIKSGSILILAAVFLFGMLLEACAVRPGPPPHRKRALKRPPRHRMVPAPVKVRPRAPKPGHVWVSRYKTPAGIVVGGYYRPPAKVGFVWRDGYWNDVGIWVAAHWVPVNTKAGHVWVGGFWDGTVWIDGFWRPATKNGFAWIAGHRNKGGTWVPGHWKKR